MRTGRHIPPDEVFAEVILQLFLHPMEESLVLPLPVPFGTIQVEPVFEADAMLILGALADVDVEVVVAVGAHTPATSEGDQSFQGNSVSELPHAGNDGLRGVRIFEHL